MLLHRWIKPETSWNLSLTLFLLSCFFPCARRRLSEADAVQPGDAAQDQSKAGAAGNGAAQAVWNPFDDDTFSSLPAEEVKHEDKKPAGAKTMFARARCARVHANSSEGPDIKHANLFCTPPPSRRTIRTGADVLRGVDTGSAGLSCRQLVSRKWCVGPLPPQPQLPLSHPPASL